MYFIKLQNYAPVGSPITLENLKLVLPNFDFNRVITPEMIEPMGYGIFEHKMRPGEPLIRYKKLEEQTPIKQENGIYAQNWVYVHMTDLEKAEFNKMQEKKVRMERNRTLYATDWVLLSDSPLTEEKKQEFLAYRQALRDVSNQQGFPWDVVWPERPSMPNLDN